MWCSLVVNGCNPQTNIVSFLRRKLARHPNVGLERLLRPKKFVIKYTKIKCTFWGEDLGVSREKSPLRSVHFDVVFSGQDSPSTSASSTDQTNTEKNPHICPKAELLQKCCQFTFVCLSAIHMRCLEALTVAGRCGTSSIFIRLDQKNNNGVYFSLMTHNTRYSSRHFVK